MTPTTLRATPLLMVAILLLAACSSSATADGSEQAAPAPQVRPERSGADAPPGASLPIEQLTDLDFTVDWTAGGTDPNGRPTGGTETMWLAGHDEALFAATGYWQTPPGAEAFEGAYVMRKDGPDDDWQVELAVPDAGRFDLLKEATFTTDGSGAALEEPVTLLLASPSDEVEPYEMRVFARDDASGTWDHSVVTTDAIGTRQGSKERAYLRSLTTHTDAVTGVDAVYGGSGTGLVFRGVHDPGAPGSIRWDPTPELDPNAGRIHSMTVADGVLYAAAGVEEDADGRTGGLYRRVDGPDPAWDLVYQWALPRPGDFGGLRGLTAITMPDGRQDLLGAREEPGVVERIDPDADFAVTTEYDIRAEYTAAWGPFSAATLAAYNDILPVVDPVTGETAMLIGLWVNHPDRRTPPNNGSNYLVRQPDGTYERAVVFDWDDPLPAGQELRATRHIVASPFPGDEALYFAGFDAGGAGSKLDTAWIYRAEPR